MGHQIVKQPNGLYAIWSSVVDNFIMVNATPEEIIQDRIEQTTKEITDSVHETIDALKKGEKPYYQFTHTFQECIDWILHYGADGPNDEVLKMLGIVTEGEWRQIECSGCYGDIWMKKIREHTYLCHNCNTENVFDAERAETRDGAKPERAGGEE